MAEFSQAQVNELIDQYRNGTISKANRFLLEKQALDDPFLFDALEGYSIVKESDEKKSTPIFTLPRIGIAASLIVLVAVMFNLRSNLQPQKNQDESIAMVLENDETPAIDGIDILEEKVEGESTFGSSTLESEEEESIPIVTMDKSPDVSNEKPTTKRKSIINPIQSKPEQEVEEVVVTEPVPGKKIENPTQTTEDLLSYDIYDVPDVNVAEDTELASAQKEKQEVEIINASTFEDTQQASEATFMDSSLSPMKPPTADIAKRAKSMTYFIAEPVIGKKIFDDYAKQKIDERGLRQEKPQEVVIEFSIGTNGILTDFKHIYSGCSECAPFAIYLLQNSGEWKTVPAGSAGKARYTFIF